MKKIENKIIIIGGAHLNTLGMIRAIGQKGIIPFVIIHGATKNNFLEKSKFNKTLFYINDELDTLVEILKEISKNESIKPIVICCSDIAASFIDINYDVLSIFLFIPGSQSQGIITKMMNKETMSLFAEQCGMKIPKTWIWNKGELLSDEIEYPCITKPLLSIKGSKANIQRFIEKKELNSYLESCNCQSLQIQKIIDFDFEYQLMGLSLNQGKQIIIPGFTKILRPPKTSNTGFQTYLPISKFDRKIDTSSFFLQQIKFTGLFSMEFLRGKDGCDYYLVLL